MAGVFMELIKKQIHMNQWKGNVATQITLDDDFIVPDTMDDMEQVMLDNGEIQAEQVKPMGDKVNVKGRLEFQVLYRREGTLCAGERHVDRHVYLFGHIQPRHRQWCLRGRTGGEPTVDRIHRLCWRSYRCHCNALLGAALLPQHEAQGGGGKKTKVKKEGWFSNSR